MDNKDQDPPPRRRRGRPPKIKGVARTPRSFDVAAAQICAITDGVWPAAKERANLICTNRQSGLQPSTAAVIAYLMSVLRRETGFCLHSVETIAQAIGITDRQVKRAFKEGKELRFLDRREVPGNKHFRGSAHGSRIWETTLPILADAASEIVETGRDKKTASDGTNKSNGRDKKMPSDGTNKSQRRGQECPPITDNITGDITEDSPPPPSPASREGGSKISMWLEQLRRDGQNAHVVEHLIEPLISGLIVEHEDPIRLLRDIRDQRVLVEFPERVLAKLATRLKETRKKLVSTKDVVDAIPDATKGVAMVQLFPESPSWEAWCQHHDEAGRSAITKFYRGQGYMQVWNEWPPGHVATPRQAHARAEAR